MKILINGPYVKKGKRRDEKKKPHRNKTLLALPACSFL